MHLRNGLIIGFAAVVLAACSTSTSAPEPTFIEPEAPPAPDTVLTLAQEAQAGTIGEYFKTRHEDGSFYGNVLIAESGKVIYQECFGYADRHQKDTLTTHSRFQLASVSKSFTAYGTLLLVQQGKIALDDDVRLYIPSFPYSGITVRMLLCHRSGLNNYMYFADEVWPDRYNNPIGNEDVLKLYAQHRPMYYRPPNQSYEYSNTGYMVLASVIERVSGLKFEDYMQVHVFHELGMNETTIYRKGAQRTVPNAAIGYNGRWKVEEDTYLNGVVGDKGVYSTVNDLLKFDQAMYNGSLVSEAWLDSAYTPRNEWKKETDNYGYGFRIKKMEDDRHLIYHTGWWKGFRSYFIRDIERERTIIVLSNAKRGPFLPVNDLVALTEPEETLLTASNP